MSKITLYFSTISSNMETKKQQQRIESVLCSKKIEIDIVDVSASKECLDKMREIVGDASALAPQICKGDTHLGDFEAFENAVENGNMNEFLNL